ncbi:MAG: aminotransferase class I/II-fold pyridoxal phosphate-dependent enzyme, partial [Verrucomicrobiota bacterium]
MGNYIRQSVSEMDGYVPGEQRKDSDYIKLNTNENPYPPSPEVQQVLRDFGVDRLRRYPDPVCAELRDAIAEVHGCRAEQVFVGNGSDEILSLCTRAFVDNSQTVSYFEPSYSLYRVLAEIRDVGVEPVELGVDFQWRFPDPVNAGVFFLTNPSAPTGLLYPCERVAEFCRSFDGVVVLD